MDADFVFEVGPTVEATDVEGCQLTGSDMGSLGEAVGKGSCASLG